MISRSQLICHLARLKAELQPLTVSIVYGVLAYLQSALFNI